MLTFADTEARKYGKQLGLGTQLAHTVNNAYYFKVSFVKWYQCKNEPPGNYERKLKTLRNRRGYTQTVENAL